MLKTANEIEKALSSNNKDIVINGIMAMVFNLDDVNWISNHLIELSKLIKNVTFINGDYRESYKYIEENTFIYFDPPYRPINKTSSFTSYSKEDFNDENQKELGEYFRKINDNNSNVKLMLSNSNPKNNNEKDDFFEQIYNGFKINEIKANRMINSNKEKRGKISELLIINYEEY